MAPLYRSLLLAALLVLAAPTTHAEDEPGPRAALAARVAALPAPGTAYAFDVDCDLATGGQTLGRATFSAQPREDTASEGETFGDAPTVPGWEIRETMVLAGGAVRRELTTLLDAHFQPLRGTVDGVTPDGTTFHVGWRRTPEGFLLATTTGEGEDEATVKSTLTHDGPFLSTISALWLFCRMNLDAPGSFEATLFDAAPSPGEAHFETGAWTIPAPGTWNDVKAVVVAGTKGRGVRMEAGFDAENGAFLGARFHGSTPAPLEFRVRSADAEEEPEPGLPYTPATTARDAAKQGALGLATGDVQLLGKSIHWPTFHAAAKASYDAGHAGADEGAEAREPFPSVEAFREQVLGDLGRSLPKRPPAMIQMALQMAEGSLKEEAMDGFTRVTFPEIFRNLQVDVTEVDGVWYLARLPGRPQ